MSHGRDPHCGVPLTKIDLRPLRNLRATRAAAQHERSSDDEQVEAGYYHLLDAVSGGRVYHPRWMSKLGIPPMPAWTVVWFFDLQNWCRGRR